MHFDRAVRALLPQILLMSSVFLISGCDLLPGDGPSANNVLAAAAQRHKADPANAPRFALVSVDSKIAAEVDQFYQPQLVVPAASFSHSPAFGRLGIGDLLRVTIWEAGGGSPGLFAHEGKGAGTEVDVRIDADGKVSIPYAGRIDAAGHTIASLEHAIEANLKGKAIEPRATVFVAEPVSSSVSVQGEVIKPGLVSLVRPGQRILDAVAAAGGSKYPPYETNVRLTRGRESINASLQEVIDHAPIYNVVVAAGDSLLLSRTPRKFIALGAIAKPGDQIFTKADLTLADALGQVLGLDPQRSDAKAVQLFRREPLELAQRCGITLGAGDHGAVPVVYQVDLKDPRTYFVLSSFPVRPNDIMYVSTAPLADVGKFMQILSGATSTVAIPRTLFGNYPGGP
jgi:polysaccharide export outer membrane protein